MNSVVCAIVGVGRLGYIHAENIARNINGASLKYVITAREESARKAAEQLDVPHWGTDFEQVMKDDTVDAVIIASPTSTHADFIKQCVASKKHIFVDKPITETVRQAKEVIPAIRESGIICQIGFMRRFDPAYKAAKKRIKAGDIGEPFYFKGISRDPGSPPENFIKNSGGIFIDMCIHEYDIARFLLEQEVKAIQTFGSVQLHPFMEKYMDIDQSLSYLVFEKGATADIEGSRNSMYGYDIRGEIVGTEGAIQIGSMQHEKNVILTKKKTYYDNIPDFPTKYSEAFLKEMEHFITCVQNGERPSVDEEDGLRSLQVAEAAKKSFCEHKKIYL